MRYIKMLTIQLHKGKYTVYEIRQKQEILLQQPILNEVTKTLSYNKTLAIPS